MLSSFGWRRSSLRNKGRHLTIPYFYFSFPLLLLVSTTILDMQHVNCIMQEGKLRVLQYDGAYDGNYTRPNFFLEENMVEVEQYSRLW